MPVIGQWALQENTAPGSSQLEHALHVYRSKTQAIVLTCRHIKLSIKTVTHQDNRTICLIHLSSQWSRSPSLDLMLGFLYKVK